MKMRTGLLLAGLWFLSNVGSSFGGYVIRLKYTDHAYLDRPATLLTFLDERKVKIETSAVAGYPSAIFFDRDVGNIVQVRYADHTYLQLNAEKLANVQRGIRGTADFLQSQFDHLDMQVFAKSEDREPVYRLEKPRRQKMIDGFPCREVKVYADGRLVQEIWYTSWEQAGIRKSDMIALIELGAFYEKMGDMPGAASLTASMMRIPVGRIVKQTGYPVMIKLYEQQRLKLTINLGAPRKTKLRPAVFQVPAGYKRVWM